MSETSHQRAGQAAASIRTAAERRFFRRALTLLLIGIAALILWQLSQVLVLAFGAVLLALVLRRLAALLRSLTGLRANWALSAVVLALAAMLGLVIWLFGSHIAAQLDDLAERLPESVTRLLEQLASHPLGRYVLQQVQGVDLPSATPVIASAIAKVLGSSLQAIAYFTLVLIAGIYLAAQPGRYRQGLLCLVPLGRRPRASEFADVAGRVLQRWLLGQLVVMTIVGMLIGLGLWLLGIRAALALGLIGGLLAFIPIIGPILAAAPAILMALAQDPLLGVYTALMYVGVHVIEGNLVTPLVQAAAASLPPVLTLFAAFAVGLLLGPGAVLIAAPLTVLLLVAVRMLYIEDVLGEWHP